MGKKPTLADKAARKAIEQPAIAQQWEFYVKMFGPVLEPAWPGDDKARIQLINLLNQIGRREGDAARKTMAALEKSCGVPTPAEETLMHFLRGLLADAEGDAGGMAEEYLHVMQGQPDFYLPWQKVAQVRQRQYRYAEAAEYLDKAISLRFSQRAMGMALSGLYANLSMCLLLMHRYGEARHALETAERLAPYPTDPVRALLHAVEGELPEAAKLCREGRAAAVWPQVRDIQEGVHPHFCLIPDADAGLPALQAWLADNAAQLNAMDDASASDALSRRMMQDFPCLTQVPPCAVFRSDSGQRTLTLHDYWGRTPQHVIKAACGVLSAYWGTEQAH